MPSAQTKKSKQHWKRNADRKCGVSNYKFIFSINIDLKFMLTKKSESGEETKFLFNFIIS